MKFISLPDIGQSRMISRIKINYNIFFEYERKDKSHSHPSPLDNYHISLNNHNFMKGHRKNKTKQERQSTLID